MAAEISLLDRIKIANSNDELLELKTEGFGYKYASVNTRTKWKKASLSRKTELQKATDKPIEEAKPKQRTKTDKKGEKKRRDR